MSTETLKVKEKKPGQRACDEKDAKGELCVGHLKRWYYYHPIRLTASEDEAAATRQFGKVASQSTVVNAATPCIARFPLIILRPAKNSKYAL